MKTNLFFVAIAFLAMGSFVKAQTSTPNSTTTNDKAKTVYKSCYVDANHNNICDHYENKTCTRGNGKGLMNGNGNGYGNGYGKGKGNGRCYNCGKGHGPNFVDANKNGICDHRETTK